MDFSALTTDLEIKTAILKLCPICQLLFPANIYKSGFDIDIDIDNCGFVHLTLQKTIYLHGCPHVFCISTFTCIRFQEYSLVCYLRKEHQDYCRHLDLTMKNSLNLISTWGLALVTLIKVKGMKKCKNATFFCISNGWMTTCNDDYFDKYSIVPSSLVQNWLPSDRLLKSHWTNNLK